MSGAVAGSVFASPNSNQVKALIEAVGGGSGNNPVLVIAKQYTGDVLLFGRAVERINAKSTSGSPSAKLLIVGEDVSVPPDQITLVGKRGLAATVLVYKIAGAAAQLSHPLDSCYNLAKYVGESSFTLGVGLDHCQWVQQECCGITLTSPYSPTAFQALNNQIHI